MRAEASSEQVPTRIKWGFLEDGTKVRIASKSGAIIPKPGIEELEEYTALAGFTGTKVQLLTGARPRVPRHI
jgi:hypothetical protein